MSRRYLVAAFLVWHLTAIVLGAIPSPTQLSNFPARTGPSPLGPAFDSITAAIDRLTHAAFVVPRALWWVSTPIHGLAARYLALAGVGQSWAMFSNPPQYAEYVRTRYYVQPAAGRLYTATDLVSPALREDQIRLLESFRASYQDKAIAIALSRFYSHRNARLIRPDTRSKQLPDDLAPIGRYFARKYTDRALAGTGARIVRTEVWVGRAATAALGEPRDQAARVSRRAALQAYYDGTLEERLNVPLYPPYHGGETEADIQWLLEYFEEQP